jgi:hypothetical protein
MPQITDFQKREIAFLANNQFPHRGHHIGSTKNLETLQKILKIQKKPYNTYVTIAKYSQMPKFPLNQKQRWQQFKNWVKIRDQTITSIDFMLDFDSTPTTKGLTKAWKDVQTATQLLTIILGEQSKYLTIWFSGNKGFHILGKTRVLTTAQENVNKMLNIALQLKPLCPTLDTSIYDTARLRKLLGSHVYSDNFGKTRVIPIQTTTEFNQLIQAIKQQNTKYFEDKTLLSINNITL